MSFWNYYYLSIRSPSGYSIPSASCSPWTLSYRYRLLVVLSCMQCWSLMHYYTIIQQYGDIIMSSSQTSPDLAAIPADKQKQRELSIRRAEYLKKLKIHVKLSDQKIDDDRLIIIQTFNTEKKISIEMVMRRLSQLDSFVAHINSQFGGHIIPVFTYNLYFQDRIEMTQLVPCIEEYLNDLKHNKYCRQDLKFYCFIIEQHAQFPRELGLGKIISNATDKSRRYLNDLFTRKNLPSLKDTNTLFYAYKQLKIKIEQYIQVKQVSLIKSRQTLVFQQISEILAELSAWPGIAIEPQQLDIQFICKGIRSSEKLIEQANQAYIRWERLADSVMELQNNVYKGLHEFQWQFNEKNQQLKAWSQSLSRQFNDLNDYLTDKIQALCIQVYKINKRFIDMTVFAGQSVVIEEDSSRNLVIEESKQVRVKDRKNKIQMEIKQRKQQRAPQRVEELQIKIQKNQNQSVQDAKQRMMELDAEQISEDIEMNSPPLQSIKKYSNPIQTSNTSDQITTNTSPVKPKQQIKCEDN